MKILKFFIFIFCLFVIFQIIGLPSIKADDNDEFISSTRVIATVTEDDSVDFQEIVIFKNPTDKTLKLKIGIPIVYYWAENNSQYSYYPFKEWNYIKDADLIPAEEMGGVDHLPLEEIVAPGKSTGVSLRAFVGADYLSKKNEIYTLHFIGGTESYKHEVEVRLPLKKSVSPFFYSDLRIKETLPFYPKQIDEGSYRKIIWDEYFYSNYNPSFNKNITWHDIIIKYEYELNTDSLNNFLVGLFTGILTSVIVGGIGWIIKKKLKSERKNSKSKNKK